MRTESHTDMPRFSIADAARARVATYLYQVYASDDGLLGDLDRWTQRRITEENLSLIHISEPTRPILVSRMPSSA